MYNSQGCLPWSWHLWHTLFFPVIHTSPVLCVLFTFFSITRNIINRINITRSSVTIKTLPAWTKRQITHLSHPSMKSFCISVTPQIIIDTPSKSTWQPFSEATTCTLVIVNNFGPQARVMTQLLRCWDWYETIFVARETVLMPGKILFWKRCVRVSWFPRLLVGP
jgi:hypothetical protein